MERNWLDGAPHNALKLNSDGALKNSKTAGAGAVFRNTDGEVVRMLAKPMYNVMVLEAEAE